MRLILLLISLVLRCPILLLMRLVLPRPTAKRVG